jgi:AraC-like DNA-binding protein
MAGDNIHEDWLYRIAPVPHVVAFGAFHARWGGNPRLTYDHDLTCTGPDSPYEIEIEGEVFELPPESYLIIPPGRWHVRRSCTDERTWRAWMQFDYVYRGHALGQPILAFRHRQPEWERVQPAPHFVPDRILTGKIRNFPVFRQMHARLNERFNHGTTRDRLVCRGLALELLLELLAPQGNGRAAGRGQQPEQIRAALDDLAEEPFDSAPSIRDYLASLGQSYDHQARVFKEEFGVTPLQYVNSRRIMRARDLLKDTQYQVQEIASRLGFRSVRYFNRLFKEYTDCTPTQYRDRVSPGRP